MQAVISQVKVSGLPNLTNSACASNHFVFTKLESMTFNSAMHFFSGEGDVYQQALAMLMYLYYWRQLELG
jgi:hypothetical protein